MMRHNGGHSGRRTETVGVGFANIGNSCFMNSVLQCLTHTPPLNSHLRRRVHAKRCNRKPAFCSACRIEELVLRAFSAGAVTITPRTFGDALPQVAKGFRLGRQEDAHEYLRHLLEHLTKCYQPAAAQPERRPVGIAARAPPPAKLKDTVIQSIFQGSLRSQVVCLSCHAESSTYDPFLDLSLELGGGGGRCHTLADAMRRFTKPEYLDGANGYRCESCGRVCRAKKQLKIHSAPRVLTIHLKRFSFGGGFGAGKITSHVGFDFGWDVGQYCVEGDGPVRYRLYGVLVHEGGSTNSGHYYAFSRPCDAAAGAGGAPSGGGASGGADGWHVYNDAQVRPVSEQTVASASAYILFYERVTPERKVRQPPPANATPVGRGASSAAPIGPPTRPDGWSTKGGAANGGAIGPLPRPLSAKQQQSPPAGEASATRTREKRPRADETLALRLRTARDELIQGLKKGEWWREEMRALLEAGRSMIRNGAIGASDSSDRVVEALSRPQMHTGKRNTHKALTKQATELGLVHVFDDVKRLCAKRRRAATAAAHTTAGRGAVNMGLLGPRDVN